MHAYICMEFEGKVYGSAALRHDDALSVRGEYHHIVIVERVFDALQEIAFLSFLGNVLQYALEALHPFAHIAYAKFCHAS